MLEAKLIKWIKERQLEIAVANTETPKPNEMYLRQCGIYEGLGEALHKITELLREDDEK